MSKKNPGNPAGGEVNITDQDELSADELAQMAEMEAADGPGGQEEIVQQPQQQRQQPRKPQTAQAQPKKPAAAAAAPKDGEEGAEGEGEGEGDGRQRMVPHGALHEERQARRQERAEFEARLKTAEETNAKIMDRFEKFVAAIQPKAPEPEAPKEPDFQEDPAGWIKFQMEDKGKTIEELRKEISELKTGNQQRTEVESRQATIRDVMNYAVAKENDFKAKTPDYDAASDYLVESQRFELELNGLTADQVEQQIQFARLSIAAAAKQKGTNPAELIYQMAQKRGYKPQQDAEGEGGGEQQQQQQRPSAEARLAAARKGQQQSGGLSGARGNAPAGLTVQALLEMSDAEFDEATSTPEGRKLMGV